MVLPPGKAEPPGNRLSSHQKQELWGDIEHLLALGEGFVKIKERLEPIQNSPLEMPLEFGPPGSEQGSQPLVYGFNDQSQEPPSEITSFSPDSVSIPDFLDEFMHGWNMNIVGEDNPPIFDT